MDPRKNIAFNLYKFNSEINKLSTVGKPSPNVSIKILKENKLLRDNVGEILVKGQMTSKDIGI